MTPDPVLSPAELDAAGKELYDDNANKVKPSWDQLGDYTKQVWRDYVLSGIKPLDLMVEEEGKGEPE
jgi:hypothetical protein